jgi:hypothetical protein
MTYQKPLAALEDEPELVAASPEELPSPAKKLPTATIAIIQSKVRKKLELAASPERVFFASKGTAYCDNCHQATKSSAQKRERATTARGGIDSRGLFEWRRCV